MYLSTAKFLFNLFISSCLFLFVSGLNQLYFIFKWFHSHCYSTCCHFELILSIILWSYKESVLSMNNWLYQCFLLLIMCIIVGIVFFLTCFIFSSFILFSHSYVACLRKAFLLFPFQCPSSSLVMLGNMLLGQPEYAELYSVSSLELLDESTRAFLYEDKLYVFQLNSLVKGHYV